MNEKPKFAVISALIIEALAPMLRECDESSSSLDMFIKQIPIELFGLYVLPVENGKGTIVAALESHRMLAIADPDGHAKEALKIHLPKGAIKAATSKKAQLFDENGEPFSVVMQPAPRSLHCSDGFVIVMTDHQHEWQQKEYPGMLGSWFNGDHGNVIDLSSYRMEPAKENIVKSIRGFIEEAKAVNTGIGLNLKINLSQLSAIAHAASVYGQPFQVFQSAEESPLCFRSDNDGIFGVLMPLKDKE